MQGSSNIPLPGFIMKKKGIVNIQNRNQKCFLWSVFKCLHERENPNPQKINDIKQYENEVDFKGIDFPVKLKDNTKFENQNPSVPGINVFSVSDNNKFYPLRITQKGCEETLDLFLYEEDGKSHYSLITNFIDCLGHKLFHEPME